MTGQNVNSSPGDLRAAGTDAVTARWVRDDTYRDRAVRLAFLDRPGLARFLAPLWIALAVALVFSPWGAMVGLFTLNLREVHASMLILAALMLLLGGANTFHAMHAATARQFAFAGDSVYWRFTPHGLSYRVTGGDGVVRHGADSQWSWFKAMAVDATGLRLFRRGTAESYFIPAAALDEPGQNARSASAQVVRMAQAAGLPVRRLPPADHAGTVGGALAVAVLLVVLMVYAAIVAAWPWLRYGRMAALFTSGVATFWWAALLLAPALVGLHRAMGAWQQRRHPDIDRPSPWPHVALALVWTGLLLAVMQCLRGEIYEDALAQSQFLVPEVAACAAVLALLMALVLHRCVVTPWVARRVALHNDDPCRLESP